MAETTLYSETAHGRLQEVYATVDAECARLGVNCDRCGSCCHFPPDGPVLCATELELDYLWRSLPLESGNIQGARCPYRLPQRCQVYERRPLACRIHFCQADARRKWVLDRIFVRAHKAIAAAARQDGREAAWLPALPALQRMASQGRFFDGPEAFRTDSGTFAST